MHLCRGPAGTSCQLLWCLQDGSAGESDSIGNAAAFAPSCCTAGPEDVVLVRILYIPCCQLCHAQRPTHKSRTGFCCWGNKMKYPALLVLLLQAYLCVCCQHWPWQVLAAAAAGMHQSSPGQHHCQLRDLMQMWLLACKSNHVQSI